MTLEDQIYSLLCPEGSDQGTCNWARKKAGEITGLLVSDDDPLMAVEIRANVAHIRNYSLYGVDHVFVTERDGETIEFVRPSLNDSPESVNVD